MALQVESITVTLPDKAKMASGRGFSSRKPQAHIYLDMSNAESWTLYTPVRVARMYRRELPDTPVDYDELLEGLRALEHKMAFEILVEMLGRRDHSVGEARSKLVRYGFRTDAIEEAVDRALARKFLNDARFCENFIEQKKLAGWGERRVALELRRRGIDVSELAGWPEAYFDSEDDLERALKILGRKSIPEKNAYAKFCAHLARKGFDYRTASLAAKQRIAASEG